MAPSTKRKSNNFNVVLSLNNFLAFGKSVMFDPAKIWIVAVVLCIAELFVNLLVIWKVKCKVLLNIELSVYPRVKQPNTKVR